MLRKFIYRVGCLIRNPSIDKCYEDLKKSEFYSNKELHDLQQKKLRTLLKFCYQHSTYYRNTFDNIGLNPLSDPISLDVLSEIPILSKDDLIKFNAEIHTINSFKFKKKFFSETSGSTGQALTFYKDEVWDSYNRSSINRGLSWFSISPWDRNGYFWGFNFVFLHRLKTKLLDFLLCRFRLFSYSANDLDKFLNKCKRARYLEGYSSMIYEVAKLANKKGVNLTNIQLIKGTSEKIYPHYSSETLKAFGKKIISEYGSAESGIIAFECPEGNMHLNEETCIVECIDGKAIVTNLVAMSFPTIRYDLGDYIELSDIECDCGRKHKVLKEVTGRVGKNIIGFNNKYPSLTLYYIFKNIALSSGLELTYRCEQSTIGFLTVYLEVEVTEHLISLLDSEFGKYFKNDIKCEYVEKATVRVKGRKLKDFESFID